MEYEIEKDEEGFPIPIPITFDDRQQISKYYQENMQDIHDAFIQKQYCIFFPKSKRLTQALGNGLRKLAKEAGILKESENTHEK